MKTSKFVVAPSLHGMPSIEAIDLSLEQCQKLRAIVCNNYIDSEDYKLGYPTGRFLQGYAEPSSVRDRGGWILVEFWNSRNKDAIQAFVDHINSQLDLKSPAL